MTEEDYNAAPLFSIPAPEQNKTDDVDALRERIARNILKRVNYILEKGGSTRDLEVLIRLYEVVFLTEEGD